MYYLNFFTNKTFCICIAKIIKLNDEKSKQTIFIDITFPPIFTNRKYSKNKKIEKSIEVYKINVFEDIRDAMKSAFKRLFK